jgi:hypothetical protein
MRRLYKVATRRVLRGGSSAYHKTLSTAQDVPPSNENWAFVRLSGARFGGDETRVGSYGLLRRFA